MSRDGSILEQDGREIRPPSTDCADHTMRRDARDSSIKHGRHGDAIGRVDRILAAARILANITHDRLRSTCSASGHLGVPRVLAGGKQEQGGSSTGARGRGICPLCDLEEAAWDLQVCDLQASSPPSPFEPEMMPCRKPSLSCSRDGRGARTPPHTCGADERCPRLYPVPKQFGAVSRIRRPAVCWLSQIRHTRSCSVMPGSQRASAAA